MKKCPQCGREYDNTMGFCLDDGAELLYGPAPADEPATAILHSTAAPVEAATRAHIHMTDQTAILPTGTGEIVPKSRGFDKRFLLAPLLLAIFVVGGFFAYKYFSPIKQIESIAVMPFVNESGNADVEYLSDGMTETLIKSLSQVPNLAVKARSTVFYYKGKEASPKRIGEELGVQAVLLGRVGGRGDDLKLSLELVNTETQDVIWSEQYDRKQSDLVHLQSDIARDVSAKLKSRLSGVDEAKVTKIATTNPEAYQLYMKGRFHWARRSKDDLYKAIENYKQAIAIDPQFALAYVGVATAYNSMGKNPEAAPKDTFPFGKTAALRALEIDPTLPEAHAALADALVLYDWNWTDGERAFRRAVELDPRISYTHLTYGGSFLNAAGRRDEFVREMEVALELEPLSLINNSLLSMSYILTRQNDKALRQGQKAYDLDPDFPLAAFTLGLAFIANGRAGEAVKLGESGIAKSPASQNLLFLTGLAYANDNRRNDADRIIRKLNELSESQYVRRYYLACIYAALGEKDKTFAELDRAAADKDAYLPRSRIDPMMDPLRDDPRFKDLLKRMNLPE